MAHSNRTYHVVREKRGQWALVEDRPGFPLRTLQLYGNQTAAKRALNSLVSA